MLETLMLKLALTLMFGLVGWAGAVVAIGLVTAAARAVIDTPQLAWANDNMASLALALTATAYAWLRYRPARA